MKMKNMLGGVVAVAVAMVAGVAQAQIWTQTAAGTYAWTEANWDEAYPNGQDATANLNIDLLGAQTINLGDAITLGTLNLGDTGSTYFGTTIAAGGGSLIMQVASGSATIAKATTANNVVDTISANIALNSNLIVDNAATAEAGAITLSGVISGNDRSLTKNGAGHLILTQTNTHSGGTVLNAGTLRINNKDALGTGQFTINGGTFRHFSTAGAVITNDILVNGNFSATLSASWTHDANSAFKISQPVTLTWRGGDGDNKNLQINSVITDASGGNTLNAFDITYTPGGGGNHNRVTLAGNITLRGNQTLTANPGAVINNTFLVSGVISEPEGQSYGLTVAGSSTTSRWLRFSNANTYTGATTINSGAVLGLNNVNALQHSALNANSAGKIMLNSTNGAAYTFGGITGGATALATVINTNYNYMNELVLNPQGDASNTYNGVIANGAANMKLTKTGSGTQILGGDHTYTGATTVNEGTLIINGSLAAASDVAVNDGGTIGGSGTINGALDFAAGAKLSLTGATLESDGSSTGILTVAGDKVITLTDFALSGITGWDWLNAEVGTYTLINGGSSVSLAGTTPTESNRYDFGNGKQGYFQSGSLQLVVIPEPATFGIVLSVLAAAVIRRKRFG